MNIVFVCNELPPAPAGGIGAFVSTMAVRLAALGHSVAVVGLYDRDYGWALPNVTVHPIRPPLPSRYRWLSKLRAPQRSRQIAIHRKLRELHAGKPIDVVEWPDYEGLYWQPINGVTDIVRVHGPLFSHRTFQLAPLDHVVEAAECRMLRQIPNWIGVSHWFTDFVRTHSQATPRHETVIYNAVDTDLFRPAESAVSPNRVLYAGSLMERKGVINLVRSAGIFLRQHPAAELLIVGKDEHRQLARINSLIEPDIRDRVILMHPVEQAHLARLMRHAAVFAMPSLLESFGNVWAEAMASGVPVVGSTATCGPEIVPQGEAGLLADPEDPASIAGAVSQILSDSALRARLGRRGREIAVDRYALESCAQKTLTFYAESQRSLT